MAEYIEREAACSLMPDDYYGWRDKQILKSIPAADVQFIRHGRWVENKSKQGKHMNIRKYWNCSECGIEICSTLSAFDLSIWSYCPVCGAHMMDKDEE